MGHKKIAIEIKFNNYGSPVEGTNQFVPGRVFKEGEIYESDGHVDYLGVDNYKVRFNGYTYLILALAAEEIPTPKKETRNRQICRDVGLAFERITTGHELSLWAYAVKKSTFDSTICALQDLFARSNWIVMVSEYSTLPRSDKMLISFALNKAMGDLTFYDFIDAHIDYMANKKAATLIESKCQEIVKLLT